MNITYDFNIISNESLNNHILTILYWIINKFRLNNISPILSLLLSISILFPNRVYNSTKKVYFIIQYVIDRLILNKKFITIEIPCIHMDQINHVFNAFDWYLKSKRKCLNSNYNIILLSDKIESSNDPRIFNLLKSHPENQIMEIEYNGNIIYYELTSKEIVSYTSNGKIEKMNYILTLKSEDMTNKDFDDMTQFVINEYAKSKINQVWFQRLFTNVSDQWSSEIIDKNKRKINTVVLQNNINFKILNDISYFIDNENWYLERGIPYKKSYLLYGPPGTGKTSLIKSISYEIKRHLHFISLSSIESDQKLNKLISKIDLNSTIIVFEDIDCMTDIIYTRNDNKIDDDVIIERNDLVIQKSNEEIKNKLTLSILLNILDGLKNNHGMIMFMTTNHPEDLDLALIRDGRIDDRIYLGLCNHEQIYKMFKNFYKNLTITFDDVKNINLKKTKLAPCNVESIFKRYYKDDCMALDKLINYDPTINFDNKN